MMGKGFFTWFKKPFREPPACGSQPIRLAIEVQSFDRGGLEQVVLDLARHLDKKRFEVVIVSLKRPGQLAEKAAAEGLEVVDLSGGRRRPRYRKLLRDRRINLTNSHFSEYGYPLFQELGIPNVTFIHNVYAFLDSRAVKRIRNNDAAVTGYISVSPNATRYAVQRLALPAEKIVTIANGLNVAEHEIRRSRCQPISRQALGIAPNDYVFLNVASYNLHKGHYLMAEAMAKILRRRSDVRLVCIGNVVHPPHLAQLKSHLRAEGLDRHMLLPGFFTQVESFLTTADAFLLPSFVEGWSIAMNEAMFYEKPMILTNTGAASEVIEDNDIGLIIPNEYGDILELNSQRLDSMAFHQRVFHTSDALAEAMLEFAEHREKWREAGRLGRKKVIERYDSAHIAKRYEDVFCRVAHPDACRPFEGATP